VRLQDVCLWGQNRFVGKLEFIRENHSKQEAEKIVEQLASQGKTSVVVLVKV
jgi:hypothetical protein